MANFFKKLSVFTIDRTWVTSSDEAESNFKP